MEIHSPYGLAVFTCALLAKKMPFSYLKAVHLKVDTYVTRKPNHNHWIKTEQNEEFAQTPLCYIQPNSR